MIPLKCHSTRSSGVKMTCDNYYSYELEFLLIILLLSSGQCLPQTKCNRIMLGDKYYDREVLWANIGRPYNLIVHKTTNTLFFSYSTPETYSDVDFQLAFYNIDTKEYQTIAGIRGGCTTTIDNSSDDIYMGGSDGIYKFNMLTKIADFYKEKGKNIWSLFHKNNLFYIGYPDQRLHIEMDGKFARVREFEKFELDHFFVSSYNEIYFANKSGLYKYENLEVKTINDLITVRQIVEDNEGNVYICSSYGILVDRKYEGFKKIFDSKNVFGLAFDRDNNFIISYENSIIRLRLSTQDCIDKENLW